MNVGISFEVLEQGAAQALNVMRGIIPLAQEALQSGSVIRVTVTYEGAPVAREVHSIEDLTTWAEENGLQIPD